LAGDGRHVVFHGAGQISSTTVCRLLEQLIEPYLEDRAALRSVDQCRFTGARSLAKALSVTEESLRRQISRFRREVAILFEKACGLPFPAESVIETRNWKGYRLNPRVRLVNIGSVEAWYVTV